MHAATRYIHDHAEELRAEARPGDELGKLTDRTVEILKESGGIKLLQAKDCGGFEAHPHDFLQWVMAVAENQPSAGWVAGVLGVHPWEMAFNDPKLQEELYGEDPDTWLASPYAPFGRAIPVDGGYRFTGEWPYSTGTDHAQWVVIGGMITDETGAPLKPPQISHFVIPREDYEIVEDSWNVMGLVGTGSKNIKVTDKFVPEYRVTENKKINDNVYQRERRPDSPLYQIRFGVIFPAAISAATIGIARGALRAATDHIAGRVSVQGNVAKSDPFQLAALAKCEADIDASVSHLMTMVDRLFDKVSEGGDITVDERLVFRRNQVRAVDRCVESINELFRLAGSSSIATTQPLERYWRDLQAGATHLCNVRETAYLAWGAHRFGGEVPKSHVY